MQELLGCTFEELVELVAREGEKPFRARQLYDAIYARRETSLDLMTDLPLNFRTSLSDEVIVIPASADQVFTSTDGTKRYLLKLTDGIPVEAVFMPEAKRDTICISSQAGCQLACDFCMTGVLGLKRNLSAGEILAQVVIVLNEVYGRGIKPPHGTNIVIMGMGEPLLNYENVIKAVHLLSDRKGIDIAARRITLSTAGIVPRIYELANERIRPRLAISLSATTDELRNKLMPINRKYPLDELMQACRSYPLSDREHLSFEYVMLKDINDTKEDARGLVRLLSGIKARVNLIPHNPAPELGYTASPIDRILEFQKVLKAKQVPCFIRRSRGQDIAAACGQLAARKTGN